MYRSLPRVKISENIRKYPRMSEKIREYPRIASHDRNGHGALFCSLASTLREPLGT